MGLGIKRPAGQRGPINCRLSDVSSGWGAAHRVVGVGVRAGGCQERGGANILHFALFIAIVDCPVAT